LFQAILNGKLVGQIFAYITRQIKSRRMRWAGHVAPMGKKRKVYVVLVGKLEAKRPLGRPRRRWDQNGSYN
jgi:hypothetical protein